ncbi:MAG TPA: biosynthetic arginine decarboxylase [Rhodanobacteraceae bacterium]|jgi:arginine decarboxylase|nr:biosynthetic arginine decarboxylase [Rhodanobacteraceae bacterium]
MSQAWTLDDARETYSVAHWSDGYVDIDGDGRTVMRPCGAHGPAIALEDAVARARGMGLRLPLLLRFPDILADRREKLRAAFAAAMRARSYAGGYTALYPIKVNQQRAVAEVLAHAPASSRSDGTGFGLEAGSKPELLAVLGLAAPGSLVVCNGYKDADYIRLALIGRKLGIDVVIVIEKPSEFEHVVHESRELGVEPKLGVRVRLASIGAGKWQNTGGDKSKFGLTPAQLLALVARLREAGLTHAMRLLHFHMGSQISNLRDIGAGMREAVRHFAELRAAGLPLDHVDVGGGLGVDYEGTRSRGECSINYDLDQYADAIVAPLAAACADLQLDPPHVLTESGRAMTAHHAVLVVNVSEVERAPQGEVPPAAENEPGVLRSLREALAALGERPVRELWQDAQQYLNEGHLLYSQGQLDLAQRARLDELYHAVALGVRKRLKPEERSHREIADVLDMKLVDKYFCNFSVFESVPDVWAIDQVFPIMPLARLGERPTRRGALADLTCDSDGRIDVYVESGGLDVSLPLHELREGESYRLGIFLVGAYQETLGDIHNLFGDTDAVNVRIDGDGFALDGARRGDSADMLLDYVGYRLDDLRAVYGERIAAAGIEGAAAQRMEAALEAGLTGYTYLRET